MKDRVLLDTNVLVSASVYMTVEGGSHPVEVKHQFFDDSMNLVGLLRTHVARRIGLITSTIENEALSVIERAARSEIERSQLPREQLFNTLSTVLTRCEDRMREIMQILQREPIRPEDLKEWKEKVNQTYDELIQRAAEVDVGWETTFKTRHAPSRFRPEARKIYSEQARALNRQITQLRYDLPNETDRQILAEAAYLRYFYAQTSGKLTFYLASNDTHFSPMKAKGGLVSREVTDRILKDFHIVCDWPAEVAKSLQAGLK